MAETQKERIMKYLGVSTEEADEILAYDAFIDKAKVKDRGEHDLSIEAEKAALKEAHKGQKHATVYKFDTTQKKRKENPTKSGIIAELAKFLEEASEFATINVDITNKERQIAFSSGDESFELTLVQKRKKKQ